MAPRKKPAPKSQPRPPVLEWAMGLLGLLIVLGVLTVILGEAFSHREPAAVEARLVSARPGPAGWLAEVKVTNAGDETAAQVGVEGRLGDETASAVVDYVPARSEEHVVLAFASDPRTAAIRVTGWSEP